MNATYHLVAPGFFDTLGMRILRGRDFDLHDDESRPLAAIVSVRLAQLLAPSGDAIGQRVRIGEKKTEFEIVGIASDATLDDPRVPNAPAIYGASFQRPDWLGWSAAIVRTPGDPARLGPALRARIESLGREYPLLIETVDREVDRILLPERVLALLTSFFGALGLLLAAVGLYGLLSYTVSRRTREIGVRVALGASRGAIAGLVLRDVALLLAIGLVAGLALALDRRAGDCGVPLRHLGSRSRRLRRRCRSVGASRRRGKPHALREGCARRSGSGSAPRVNGGCLLSKSLICRGGAGGFALSSTADFEKP